MAVYKVNWSDMRQIDSPVPTDVVFKVTEETITNRSVDKKQREFLAHKQILSAVSDIFSLLFSGRMKEEKKIFEITNTTVKAFEMFLDFIYSDNIDHNASINTLLEILNLSEKYKVMNVKMMVTQLISDININEDNFMEIANIARNYSNTSGFKIISENLMKRCSNFMYKPEKKRNNNVAVFVKKFIETHKEADWFFLLQLISLNASSENSGNGAGGEVVYSGDAV